MDKFTRALIEGRIGVEALVAAEVAKAYESMGMTCYDAIHRAIKQLGWQKTGESDFMPEVLTEAGDEFHPQLRMMLMETKT